MESYTVTADLVHKEPDLVVYRNFLSKEECNHMIKLAEPHLARSATFSGKSDPRRTSRTAFATSFLKDPTLQSIMRRSAIFSGHPLSHVEPPQLVRYLPGEQFMGHMDNYPKGSYSYRTSGQRDSTFFLYLNEPGDSKQTGGETEFFRFKPAFKVVPERGSAVFWRNIQESGDDDERYYHRGLPPQEWTKWGMNIWIRNKPYKG
jgi:prolyl 4-hydroxylase